MERSRYIAGLIGPVMLIVAASLLANPGLIDGLVEDVAESPALILTSGVLAMLAGLAILRGHNVWRGWPVIISLFGVLSLVGGAARILFPQWIADMATAMVANTGWLPVTGAFLGVLGAFLTWQSLRRDADAPTSYEPPKSEPSADLPR